MQESSGGAPRSGPATGEARASAIVRSDLGRLAALRMIAETLTRAATPEAIAGALIDHGIAALGADWCLIYRLVDDELALVDLRGATADSVGPWRRLPLDLRSPLTDAVRTGRSIFLERTEEIATSYPESFARIAASAISMATVPLAIDGRPLGGIALGFLRDEGLHPDDRSYVEEIARLGAHALDRARLFVAEAEARAQAELAASRMASLQELSEAIAGTEDGTQIARIALARSLDLFGAHRAVIYLADENHTAAHSFDAIGISPDFTRIPFDGSTPLEEAIRSAAPIYVESFADLERRWPRSAAHVAAAGGPRSAFVVFPLVVEGRSFGALSLAFDEGRTFGAQERTWFGIVARQVAHALERTRLHAAEREAHARLEILIRAGDLLSSSLDYETTLANVARAATPSLCDFGFFDVVEGDEVRRIAVAHADPELEALLSGTRWVRSERRDLNLCALSSGKSGHHPSIDDAWMQKIAVSPEHLAVLRKLAFRSMITVPLRSADRTARASPEGAAGRLLGALTLFHARSGRNHTVAELRVAEELARRAAVALENARLFREREAAIQTRDDFLSIASHELNTPLTSLRLQLHTLARDPATPQRRIAAIDRQISRLSRLVGDLLDVSRMTSGRLPLATREVDLGTLVRAAASRLSADAASSGSEITIEAGEPVAAEIDPERIDQVVTNLLVNAIKYGEGRPIVVRVEKADGRARLVVEDRGIGIAPAAQDRIFERFERAVPSAHYGGLGLGLWIARQVVEAHGGAISVESELGRGSTFRVDLPLSQA